MFSKISLLATLSLLAAACAVDGTGTPQDPASESSDELASPGTPFYFTWSKVVPPTTIKDPNGGLIMCADGHSARACTVDQIVYPASCNWECVEGIGPGSQGSDLLLGTLQYKTVSGKRQRVLRITAGWDTSYPDAPRGKVYRVTAKSATCAQAPCPAAMTARPVNATSGTLSFGNIDFATAQDVNYHSQPGRGFNEVTTAEGLFLTGRVVRGTFVADQVYRRWVPELACDAYSTAFNYWHDEGGGHQVDFRTETEAWSYVPATPVDGRKWIVRDQESPTMVRFTGGINDLWAVRFTIDKRTCELAVVAEH